MGRRKRKICSGVALDNTKKDNGQNSCFKHKISGTHKTLDDDGEIKGTNLKLKKSSQKKTSEFELNLEDMESTDGERIAILQASIAKAELKRDFAKVSKKRQKLEKIIGEKNVEDEFEGIVHEGCIYLLDRLSGKIYDGIRSDKGDLVEVGWMDKCTKEVTISKMKNSEEANHIDDNAPSELEITGFSGKLNRTVQPFGKWFPNAKKVTGAMYNKEVKISILLFYTYVEPLWTLLQQHAAIRHSINMGCKLNLGGRLRIAKEGFNATVSGTYWGVRKFSASLREFDPAAFKNTDFKYIDRLPMDQSFKDLNVFPVTELVHYGIGPESAPALSKGGVHLSAEEYHLKMQEANTVVIDVRNAYESDIGHFVPPKAQLIDPAMRVSTDFPNWLSSEETKAKLKGKNVMMYCTGGIRCERASALLKHEYGDSIQNIYQLQGGIEAYLKTFPDGGYWKGKNFTFDKRNAIEAYEKPKTQNKEVLGECAICEEKWDKYEGKRRCTACPVPILICQSCLTKQADKKSENSDKLRCPLCKKEEVFPCGIYKAGSGKSLKSSDYHF